jgi:putative sporulation protein YtaF
MPLLFPILEAALISSTLSVDSFAAGLAYGSKKIQIPRKSTLIIAVVCTAVTSAAFFAGHILSAFLPQKAAVYIAFTALFTMGTVKLLDSFAKTIIKKLGGINTELKFSVFNIKLILTLYANPETADIDANKQISAKEATLLAASLSLDGIAVGFGAALFGVNPWALIILSFIANILALSLGFRLGEKISKTLPFNTSYLAGIILIALAVSRFI